MNQQFRDRNREIIRCGMIGAGMNLLLSVIKIIAGTAAHAHALIMDGVNSFSDMAASLISMLSSFIAAKRGNRANPFGYGRMEYLSSLAMTMFILYLGVRSIVDSVRSILHPHDPPSYTLLTLIVVLISIVSKLVYGGLMLRKGKQLHSSGVSLSALDSLGDALISAGILAAIVVFRLTGADIEHYVCIAVSLLIIRTGVKMMLENGTKMLGGRPDPALRKELISRTIQEEQVLNISNVMLHNYGEGNYIGSLDIEVDERMTAGDCSRLCRRIIRKAEALGIRLTSVGICGTNWADPASVKILDAVIDLAKPYPTIRRISSFIIDPDRQDLSFWVVQDYAVKASACEAEFESFRRKVCETWPAMNVDIHKGIDA